MKTIVLALLLLGSISTFAKDGDLTFKIVLKVKHTTFDENSGDLHGYYSSDDSGSLAMFSLNCMESGYFKGMNVSPEKKYLINGGIVHKTLNDEQCTKVLELMKSVGEKKSVEIIIENNEIIGFVEQKN